MLKARESKIHNSFGMYLSRNKVESAYSVASLFIDKFAKTKKPSDWQVITVEDLKQKNILPSKKHATFSHWRDEMIKNRVLICMATREELQEKNPTHKGSMFKIGDRLKKYIDQAIYENLPKNVEDLNNKVDILSESLGVMDNKLDVNVSDLNNKVTSVDNKVERLESEVNTLKKKVESMAAMILKALPPDTPLRRDIVEENIHDQEKCFQKLEDETKQKSNYN